MTSFMSAQHRTRTHPPLTSEVMEKDSDPPLRRIKFSHLYQAARPSLTANAMTNPCNTGDSCNMCSPSVRTPQLGLQLRWHTTARFLPVREWRLRFSVSHLACSRKFEISHSFLFCPTELCSGLASSSTRMKKFETPEQPTRKQPAREAHNRKRDPKIDGLFPEVPFKKKSKAATRQPPERFV